MGSYFTIIMYAADSGMANQHSKRSFKIIDSLDLIFSDYNPQSELSQLGTSAGTNTFVSVSPALYHMILQSKEASGRSNSAFDISIGSLSKLWRKARNDDVFPTPMEVSRALALTGMNYVNIDTVEQRIKLMKRGMTLDPGGIAKGIIAQTVIDYLKSKGITNALADAGGDIVCSGNPPGKSGWSVGINIPGNKTDLFTKNVTIKNKSIATSGNIYQYIEHRGKKYSHIINPKTGYGITTHKNVTIIAGDAALADWLATACSILPKKKAFNLAKKYEVELIIVTLKKDKLKYRSSKGIKQNLTES